MRKGSRSGDAQLLVDSTTTGSDNSDPSSPSAEESKKHEVPSESWSNKKKWLTVTVACLACFVAGINATGVLAAAEEIATEFNIDNTVFLITAWNLAASLLPLFALPLQEDFGVLPVWYTAYFLFTIFVVVQAVAPNFATLIVARVISGACGGIIQDSVGGIIADVFENDMKMRGVGMSLCIFALLGGTSSGPAIGGGVLYSLGWRWILYIQLVVYGGVLALALPMLKDSRAHKRAETKGNRKTALEQAVKESTLRAIKMLFTEFTVATFTLFSAFCLSTVYVMTQSVPQVYSSLYDWSDWQTGVVQIAVFFGELVGLLLCLFQDLIIYPRFAIHGDETSEIVPEPRLYMAIPCAFLGLTAGYFIYGWTADPYYHWILPTLGIFLIGVGIMNIVAAITLYVTDCYVDFAASAISAIAFGENFMSAFVPLATRSMYENLGFHWASSLLGFLALALSMVPPLLVFLGPRLRARSKFCSEKE